MTLCIRIHQTYSSSARKGKLFVGMMIRLTRIISKPRDIAQSIRNSVYYSIMADETTDISTKILPQTHLEF